MRAGLHARISTHDQQSIGMQVGVMTSDLNDRGWGIAKQVKDVDSGAKDWPGRESLLKAVRRREVHVIVVWHLDRWGRSPPDLMATRRELTELGVGFVSLTETLDLTTPTGRMMTGTLAVFAGSVREILRERAGVGNEHVCGEGRPQDRPRAPRRDVLRRPGRPTSAPWG